MRMPRYLQLLVLIAVSGCASTVALNGRVVEAEAGRALPGTWVTIKELRLEVRTDSTGAFSLPVPKAPRCYLIKTAFIGYGPTFRSVILPLRHDSILTIPMRPRLVPESSGEYLKQCTPVDSATWNWGLDTVLVR